MLENMAKENRGSCGTVTLILQVTKKHQPKNKNKNSHKKKISSNFVIIYQHTNLFPATRHILFCAVLIN